MRKLKVYDESTGEVLEDIEFSGGYNIQYASNEDSGRIQHVTHLDNARFDEDHWIKNLIYRPICEKLCKKFEILKHIKPSRILFLEDTYWTGSEKKISWPARVKETNKQFQAITGYYYVVETREFYTENMSREQIVALMYEQLKHIGTDGKIVDYDVRGWEDMIATLGADWSSTKANIQNILDEDFDEWEELRKIGKQVSLFDSNVYKMRASK